MKKITKSILLSSLLLSSVACIKEEDPTIGLDPVEKGETLFAIATQIVSASTGDTSMVLLTAETLEEGSATVIGKGTELATTASEWSRSSDGLYFYSIKDNGGTLATDVVQYYLDGDTGLMQIKKQYSGAAYHTWGMWGDKFVTTRNGSSSSIYTSVTGTLNGDGDGDYYAAECTTSYCDPSGTATYDAYPTNNYIGNNYTGTLDLNNGETATVVGFATAGDYVYASYATTGVTQYAINTAGMGWNEENRAFVAQGYGSYTNSIEASNSFTATGGVPFPLTPGNAYIARYPLSGTFESTPTIIATDKMGQAFGRTTGNPLNAVVPNDDDGYVYIFSPGTTRRYSTEEAMTEDGKVISVTQYHDNLGTDGATVLSTDTLDDALNINTTNKGASVMRIKFGASSFDSSFGTDGLMTFEDKMDNYTFSRVWHISGNKFLLRVIHTQNLYNASHKNDIGDAYFYIFDASNDSITKVSGLPEPDDFSGQGNRAIGEPYIEDGMAYIPMAPNNLEYPAIWVVDSSTATSVKGLEVQCSSIVCIGKLTAQ